MSWGWGGEAGLARVCLGPSPAVSFPKGTVWPLEPTHFWAESQLLTTQLCVWAGYLPSLCLHLHIYKMGIMLRRLNGLIDVKHLELNTPGIWEVSVLLVSGFLVFLL